MAADIYGEIRHRATIPPNTKQCRHSVNIQKPTHDVMLLRREVRTGSQGHAVDAADNQSVNSEGTWLIEPSVRLSILQCHMVSCQNVVPIYLS